LLIRPRIDRTAAPMLPLAAGAAIAAALTPLLPGRTVAIKWPNDVLVETKKISGVLCEAQLSESEMWAVIGVGVNVETRQFPPELTDFATSLAILGAETLDRGLLLAAICDEISLRMERIEQGSVDEIAREVASRDALLGRDFLVNGSSCL